MPLPACAIGRVPGNLDAGRHRHRADVVRRFGQEIQRQAIELVHVLHHGVIRGPGDPVPRLGIAQQLDVVRVVVEGHFDDGGIHFVADAVAANFTEGVVTAGESDVRAAIVQATSSGGAPMPTMSLLISVTDQLGQPKLVRCACARKERSSL